MKLSEISVNRPITVYMITSVLVLLGLVTIVLNVLFIVHVMRTGRERFWIWIILGFPVVGALAYLLAEVVPELVRGPRGEKMREAAAAVEVV